MKKLALISILLIFLIGISVTALEDTKLTIKDTPIKAEITHKDTAEFDLEIISPLYVFEEIYIVSPITDWQVSVSDTRFKVRHGDSKHIQISLTPPEDIRPGKYISCFTFKGLTYDAISNYRCVFVTVVSGEPLVEVPEEEPEEKIVIDEDTVDKFMVSTKIITIRNEGNIIVTDEYKANFELLESFFVTSSPLSAGIRTVDGGKEYYWGYTLNPGDELIITYSVSYIPIIISIAVVIVALIFLISFYSAGLKIDKKLLIPSRGVGGKKAVKVKLSIKNATNKEVKNVQIEDNIPIPLKLAGDFGTLKPSVIKRTKEKTKLIWKLDSLAPREERLLSYSFKSQLKVLGKLLLPRAKLIYKKGDKQRSEVFSGILVVRGKKEERVE